MSYPIIQKNSWGYVNIEYKNKTYEYGKKHDERADVILWFNGFQKWNWKDKNTYCNHHVPGITKSAVDFLIKKKCNIIILSKGYGNPSFTAPGVLKTPQSVKKYLKDKGIKVYNLKSETAVKKWNELIKKNKKVGMYLHSTC
jgi:hypothetical protein